MVATLTSIYGGEESSPIQGICVRYRDRPARARWGKNSGSVARLAKYFRGGTRAFRTFPGKHWAVYYRATALRSPYHHFCRGQIVAKLMQLVRYALRPTPSPLLLSHSSCSTLAAQEDLAVAQLASPRLEFSPLLPFFTPSIVYCTMLCLTRTRTCTLHTSALYLSSYTLSIFDFLCRLTQDLEFETLTETIFRPQRK